MIEFTKAYVSNGKVFSTLAEAQAVEIEQILGETMTGPDVAEFALTIVKHGERIVDVLTTTASSKPKARSVNGGKKQRKPKVVPGPEQPELTGAK